MTEGTVGSPARVRFSVVIPCHNAESTLAECLESVCGLPGVEVVVVDDASTDASPEIARRYPVRRITNPRNLGPAASRNRGAEAARGEVLLFMDADVVAPPGVLERIARRLEGDPELAAINGTYTWDYPLPSLFGRFFNALMYAEMHRYPFTISTSFCAIRREAFVGAGRFDEAIGRPYSDDIAFGWKFLDAGYRSGQFPEIQVRHLKRLSPAGWVRHSILHGAWWMRSFLADFPRSARLRNRPVNSSFRAANILLLAGLALGGFLGAPAEALAALGMALFLAVNRPFLELAWRREGPGFALFSAAALVVEAACYLAGAAGFLALYPGLRREGPSSAPVVSELRQAAEYVVEGYRKRLTVEGPLFVTWFVTSVCNARCIHCFYWRNLNSHREDLTLDEVRRISATMGTFRNLLLSGGEPFLRPDLDEFCRILCNGNGVRLLTIPTNGIPVDTIVAKAEAIAESCPDTRVFIQISVDGLRETHDRIRRVPGAFDRLVATYRGIRESQRRHPNLHPTFLFSFMRHNQDEAIPTFRYLHDELGADNINMNLVRGDALDPTCKEIAVEKYRDAARFLVRLCAPDGKGRFFDRIYWARHEADYRHIYSTIKEGRYHLPCQAGTLNAVIDERGKVYTCEIMGHPIGDLREAGYDFRKVWRGEAAWRLRRRIRETRCFCTHETNASINNTFNPGSLVRSLLPGKDWGPRNGGAPAPQRGEEQGRELAGRTPWWGPER